MRRLEGRPGDSTVSRPAGPVDEESRACVLGPNGKAFEPRRRPPPPPWPGQISKCRASGADEVGDIGRCEAGGADSPGSAEPATLSSQGAPSNTPIRVISPGVAAQRPGQPGVTQTDNPEWLMRATLPTPMRQDWVPLRAKDDPDGSARRSGPDVGGLSCRTLGSDYLGPSRSRGVL